MMAAEASFANLTRRGFIGGATALGMGSVLPAPAYAQQRVRQNLTANDFNPATLDGYKRAVRAMLQLPPTDPRNWYRQAIIHLIDCPHGNWWFLPWHRGSLFHFEQICAQLSGVSTFALPFWDWTAGPRVPDVFFEDVLTPTNQLYEATFDTFGAKFQQAIQAYWNGLNQAARDDLALRGITSASGLLASIGGSFLPRVSSRGLTQQNPSFAPRFAREVAIERIRDALAPTRFEDFGSDQADQHSSGSGDDPLESGPHNNVHGAVNGFMGDFMSPVDPLFWLHHANIDRLWSLWTRREKAGGRTGRPAASDAWLKEPFRFFCDGGGQPLPNAKASDYVEEASLGYGYGPGSADDIIAAAAPVAAASGPRTFASTGVDKIPLQTFSEASLSVDVPNETLAAIRLPQPGVAQTVTPPRLVARVTLNSPSDPRNYSVLVFANCPYLSADTPITDPHYVGCISFFGRDHGGHGRTYSLPLNLTLGRLAAVGRPSQGQVKLQVLAVDATGLVKQLDGALTKVAIEQT